MPRLYSSRKSSPSRSDTAWYIISLITTSVGAATAGGEAVTTSVAVSVAVAASSPTSFDRRVLMSFPGVFVMEEGWCSELVRGFRRVSGLGSPPSPASVIVRWVGQRGTMLAERAEGGLVPMALMATTSKR